MVSGIHFYFTIGRHLTALDIGNAIAFNLINRQHHPGAHTIRAGLRHNREVVLGVGNLLVSSGYDQFRFIISNHLNCTISLDVGILDIGRGCRIIRVKYINTQEFVNRFEENRARVVAYRVDAENHPDGLGGL